MAAKAHVTRVRELLSYNPTSGEFRWRISRGGAVAGAMAGTPSAANYRQIRVDGTYYLAHRLAWLYVHGEWPTADLDHINCIRNDNRIANLRLATRSQNRANARRPRHNSSGFKGVDFHKNKGKWRARVQKDNKVVHVGRFATAEQAHEAYAAMANELFGEFARPNG